MISYTLGYTIGCLVGAFAGIMLYKLLKEAKK
jgi:hypothetical protein